MMRLAQSSDARVARNGLILYDDAHAATNFCSQPDRGAGADRPAHSGAGATAVARRTVLGHPGHVDLGAGQRRHRHRRPRQSLQRLRLPENAGKDAWRRHDRRRRIPARLRPRVRPGRAPRFDHARPDRLDRRGARDLRAETPTTCAISIASRTPPTSRGSSTSPGAARPARSKMADRWRSRPRRTAIAPSISPTHS